MDISINIYKYLYIFKVHKPKDPKQMRKKKVGKKKKNK